MKRKIIIIDEAKCNGCGECIIACAENAIAIIDGKARLVKEQYCDGLGDCLGECPTGAITIEEREVARYDAAATRAHVAATGGTAGVKRFEAAALRHGCPGTETLVLRPLKTGNEPASNTKETP
jgi:MinD superfamily P-loop ATPase